MDKDRKGQSTVEYLIVVAAIIVVIILVAGKNGAFTKGLQNVLQGATDKMVTTSQQWK